MHLMWMCKLGILYQKTKWKIMSWVSAKALFIDLRLFPPREINHELRSGSHSVVEDVEPVLSVAGFGPSLEIRNK